MLKLPSQYRYIVYEYSVNGVWVVLPSELVCILKMLSTLNNMSNQSIKQTDADKNKNKIRIR